MNPIAVAIVNHNTCQHLRACLETVEAESPAEVVVVDNVSTDGSAAIVSSAFPGVRLCVNHVNNGYGSAANQAIANSSSPYILLLNSDTRLHPGTLSALCGFFDRHPRAAVVGPRLANPDGSLQPSCYPFPRPLQILLQETTLNRLAAYLPVVKGRYLRTWSHSSSRPVPWVLGAALGIRRVPFDAVGGFNSSFFMFAEEIDLSYRLNGAGWQTHFTPEATITHVGGASIRQYRAEMAVAYYQSMARFYHLHYSKIDYLQFRLIMKAIVLARLARDYFELRLATQPDQKDWIRAGITAWQRILSDHGSTGEAARR